MQHMHGAVCSMKAQASKYPEADKIGSTLRPQSAALEREYLIVASRPGPEIPALETQPPSPPGPILRRAGSLGNSP